MERFSSDPDLRLSSSTIRRQCSERRSLQSIADWLRRSFGKGKQQKKEDTESYTALIKSLTTIIQENSPRRIKLHNVQIGPNNEMVVKEGANEDVLNAMQQLLYENKSVREEMSKERAALEIKLSHTEVVLCEMKEKLSYCKRMITHVDEKEDSADQKLVTLTEMVKFLTVERSDEEVMADLIRDMRHHEAEGLKSETEFDELPFKHQQGIRRIVGIFGKSCKWQSLARHIGMDPTTMSSCSTDHDQLDTESCTRVLQHWLHEVSPGESCEMMGKQLVDSLKGLEKDLLEDLKEQYTAVNATDSNHQDTVGAVAMSTSEVTNGTTRQHSVDHLTDRSLTHLINQTPTYTAVTTRNTMRQLSEDHITNRNTNGLIPETVADSADTSRRIMRQFSEDSRSSKAHTALILEKLTAIETTMKAVHRAVIGDAGSEAVNRPTPSPVTQVTKLYTDEEFF